MFATVLEHVENALDAATIAVTPFDGDERKSGLYKVAYECGFRAGVAGVRSVRVASGDDEAPTVLGWNAGQTAGLGVFLELWTLLVPADPATDPGR